MAECEVCGAKIKEGKRFCEVCAPSDSNNKEPEITEEGVGSDASSISKDSQDAKDSSKSTSQVEIKKDGEGREAETKNLDEDDDGKEIVDPFSSDFQE